MATTITSYKELRREKARLEALRQEQIVLIRQDWQAIKEDLKPSLMVGATLKKALTRKASGAFTNLGINLVADGLIKKGLLAHSGGISRWLIPFIVKNYASHLVGEPEKLVERLKGLFSKKKKKDGTPEATTQQPVDAVTPAPAAAVTQDAGMEAVLNQ